MLALSSLVAISLLLANTVSAAVPLYGQCGGSGHTGETECVEGATCVYSNEWYSQCLPSTAATTTTARTSTRTSTRTTSTRTTSVRTSTTARPTNTAVQPPPAGITTTLPASAGYTALPTARVISGSFNGGMVKYDRAGSGGDCAEQDELDEAAAVFILESGASISNVIIGKAQAEGIHCRGPCTLTNVWWEDVCEDAVTIKQSGSGDVSYINGGGAFGGSDKIVQHNGAGTVRISNFFANSFGKLYRACGNCSSSHQRHVIMDNICMKGGSEGAGINTNWGDTATFSNIKTNGKPSNTNVCCTYTGVSKGNEPSKIGCGTGYSACRVSGSIGSC